MAIKIHMPGEQGLREIDDLTDIECRMVLKYVLTQLESISSARNPFAVPEWLKKLWWSL